MSYGAPDYEASRLHESHRMESGRCVGCGTSPRWPLAEQECPLRHWQNPAWTSKRVQARIAKALELLDAGMTIPDVAKKLHIHRKTIKRYARLRAQENAE